ncbi:hypothetical protein [Streptomyces mirabilis]
MSGEQHPDMQQTPLLNLARGLQAEPSELLTVFDGRDWGDNN